VFDWTLNGGTFNNNDSEIDFDGSAAQTIASGANSFYSLAVSNTTANVSIADKFEFDASGTLTIDASATFATASFEFDDNGGIIANNGTFEIHGDETFTTGSLSIPGNTKIVDPAGCRLTEDLNGLEVVEFNSDSQTFTLSEDMSYITGNIMVALNTTFDMDVFDLTLADRKTVTNEGTWSAPSSGSQFTCSGNATFLGEDMNFSKFYAVSADTDTIIFKGSKTYTVSDSLILGGIGGGELLITSDAPLFRATAIINNTGNAHLVEYVKVYDVNGTAEHHIAATNSWSLGGTTDYWDFAVPFTSYTFTYSTK
jgi:hypothetical protein